MERTTTKQRDSDVVLAVGFGTTVAMWALCYLFRLPGLELPSPILVSVLLAALIVGAGWAGRNSRRSVRSGLLVGLTNAALNLMIVGSISGVLADELKTSIGAVLAGVLLCGAVVGAIGGWIGGRFPRDPDPERWRAAPAKVAPVATFFLIILGGVVTSADAGLAVYDWPTTFGQNMFLFPLSKMVGGVFYEHTHRLFGALVGCATLALAVHLFLRDHRGWLRVCGASAVVLVIVQGVVGAARVVEADVAPDLANDTTYARWLAVMHGVAGQLIFGFLLAIAAFASRTWQRLPGLSHPKLAQDRRLALILIPLVISQLLLGALLRQFGPYATAPVDAAPGATGNSWLLAHMVWAFAVLGHGLFVGARGRALYTDRPAIMGSALVLVVLFATQLLLGFAALMVTASSAKDGDATASSVADVLIPTAHQAVGAAILGAAVIHAVWLLRAGSPART